jgi:hypothetical protein
MTSYIKDVVDVVAEQITSIRFAKNTSCYLKLFRLYVGSVSQWENKVIDSTDMEVVPDWEEFYEQGLLELNNSSPEVVYDSDPLNEVTDDVEEPNEAEEPLPADAVDKTPEHIELLIKILSSTLQFFASTNSSDVIITHEIFIDSLPILHRYDSNFLPMIHQMWYPFTKQFQMKNLVILQHSFRLLGMIGKLAKDFVHKKSTEDIIPTVNKFLNQTLKPKVEKANLSYTQEFKLQREILSGYGALAVNLEIEDKTLDCIIDILLKYSKHSNEVLADVSRTSLEVLRNHNPSLICYKMKF